MTPIADKIYVALDTVITEPLEAGLAMTRIGSSRILMLNPTGVAIWRLVDGHTPCHQIASSLALQFSMPVEQITRDVYAFIERLATAGLIVEQNA